MDCCLICGRKNVSLKLAGYSLLLRCRDEAACLAFAEANANFDKIKQQLQKLLAPHGK